MPRAADVLEAAGPSEAAAALTGASPDHGGRLVGALPVDAAGAIVARMPADDAAATLRHVDRPTLVPVLASVPSHRAATLRRLLEQRPGTAGGLMSPDVLTAGLHEPLEAVRARAATLERAPEGCSPLGCWTTTVAQSACSDHARCSAARAVPRRSDP